MKEKKRFSLTRIQLLHLIAMLKIVVAKALNISKADTLTVFLGSGFNRFSKYYTLLQYFESVSDIDNIELGAQDIKNLIDLIYEFKMELMYQLTSLGQYQYIDTAASKKVYDAISKYDSIINILGNSGKISR